MKYLDDFDNDGFPGEFVYGDEAYIDDYYMDELWKPVCGFEGLYWISNKARVWSTKNNCFIKVKPMDNCGHLGVCLYHDGIRYYRYIHRLVAEAFIPNPHGYPIVRHMYDLPYRNTVGDLKWGTKRDNAFDAIRNGRAYIPTDDDREKGCIVTRIPILAIDTQSGKVLRFNSQTEASRVLNIQQSNIWKVLNGERKQAGGYTFKYVDGGEYDE